jgi:tetratricopeptide (TPR) repeat protein
MAIERNRQEIEEATARNAEALTARLQLIEQGFAAQRTHELEAAQSANRLVLMVAAGFAVVGLVAMLLTAYLQWRAVNRFAEFSTMPTAALALGSGRALPALGPGDTPMENTGVAEQSNTRLLGVIERLEKRILELEKAAHAPLMESATTSSASGPEADSAGTDKTNRLALLLAKGQSLLNVGNPEEAVACFDEVLAQDPNHPDALVKKGAALERLSKLDDAIKCYDHAIAADGSMTIAYLYKGGLFNRLERYGEALECYEHALRVQEKQRA